MDAYLEKNINQCKESRKKGGMYYGASPTRPIQIRNMVSPVGLVVVPLGHEGTLGLVPNPKKTKKTKKTKKLIYDLNFNLRLWTTWWMG
jgi:hypothetical protein